uniref:Uncharacterized protein n=1 Tax=Arundo donax TaxID=35708 RepID=A0A0A9AX87_ARUDO
MCMMSRPALPLLQEAGGSSGGAV